MNLTTDTAFPSNNLTEATTAITMLFENVTSLVQNATNQSETALLPKLPASGIGWAHVKKNFYMAEYVILPTFLIIGLFGNTLTIITMASKEFKSLTSRFILICLAVSDSVLLLSQPFNKMFVKTMFGYDPRALSDIGCKVFFHIFRTAKMTSSWLVVLLCFERFVAVTFPLKAKMIITKRTIISLIVLDYLFIGTYNAVWTFSSLVVNGVCKPDVTFPDTKEKYRYFLLAGSSFYSLIPMVVMSVLTPCIVVRLFQQRTRRRAMASNTTSSDADTSRISVMLIGVVVAYVIFVLPITVVHNLAFYKNVSAFDTNTYGFFVLRQIAQMLEQFNYSTNFILYVLCSSRFRVKIASLLRLQKIYNKLGQLRSSVGSSSKSGTAKATASSSGGGDDNISDNRMKCNQPDGCMELGVKLSNISEEKASGRSTHEPI